MNCFLCLPDLKLPSDIYLPARVLVQEMPHLSTIFPRRQLLVQENTLSDTEPHRSTISGAGNASFEH